MRYCPYALLILIGILGGFFVVPLNALLQERGKQTVGAGNAIAVQNLGENLAMLLMLGLYSLAVKVGVPVVGLASGLAGCLRLRLRVCGSGSVAVDICRVAASPYPT
jgi:LPLT family lysophospholipid transporter-like MFS transporter